MRKSITPALATLSLLSAAAQAEYTVIVDIAQPDELTATLKLPKAEGAPHRLDVRGAAWGLQPQIHSPACGGVPLKQQKNGTWIAETSCREVTWKISPVVAIDGFADVSKQATLLFQKPRWLLLSEASALLRPTGGERRRPLTPRGAGRLCPIGEATDGVLETHQDVPAAGRSRARPTRAGTRYQPMRPDAARYWRKEREIGTRRVRH